MDNVIYFRRAAQSRLLGLVTYIVIVPVMTIALWAMIGGVTYAIVTASGGSEKLATNLFSIWLPVVFCFVVTFAVRDFRRRASIEVAVADDRILIEIGNRHEQVAFADVQTMQLVPRGDKIACKLKRLDGTIVWLPVQIASFATVREVLERRLLPLLVQCMNTELEQGSAVRVADSWWLALIRVLYGVLRMLLAVPLLIVLRSRAFYVFAAARRTFRQGRRGLGSGFILGQSGLSDVNHPQTTVALWDQVHSVERDEAGIVIRSDIGILATASPFADNFWVAARWLELKLEDMQAEGN